MKRSISVFALGFVVAILVFAGGFFFYARMGFVDPRADIPVPAWEANTAMKFLDASLDRRAPDTKNPVVANDANLEAGMKLYQSNCAGCHGDIDHPEESSLRVILSTSTAISGGQARHDGEPEFLPN